MIVSVSKRVLPATPTPGENARKCFNINYKMPGEKVGWRSTEPDEESRDLDPSLGSSFCFTPSHTVHSPIRFSRQIGVSQISARACVQMLPQN